MTKQVARDQEKSRTWFRSERVFLSNGQWYFHTREGVDVGPYESQCDAEIEAGMLKELLRERGQGGRGMAIIREFVLDSFALGRSLNPHFNSSAG
jgi:hypothetical protein